MGATISNPSANKWVRHRRRHMYFGLFLLGLDAVIFASGGPLLGGLVVNKLRDRVLERTNGQLSFTSFTADFFTGSFQFQGLRFEAENDRRRIFISAERGRVDLTLGTLLSGDALIIDDLNLQSPIIEYQVKKRAKDRPPAVARGELQVKSLVLSGGRASLSSPEGARLVVDDLSLRGWSLSTRDPLALCARVALSGHLEGTEGPFSMTGSSSGEGTPSSAAREQSCQLQGFPLAPFAAFLGGGLPFQLSSGTLAGELRFAPVAEGGAQMSAAIKLSEVAPKLGSGALAMLAAQTGLPQALEARGGNLDLAWNKTLGPDEVHQDAATFIRDLAEEAVRNAISTLASAR